MLRSPLFLAFLLAFGLSYFVPYHEVDSKAQPLYYSVFTMMHDTCPKIKEPLQ